MRRALLSVLVSSIYPATVPLPGCAASWDCRALCCSKGRGRHRGTAARAMPTRATRQASPPLCAERSSPAPALPPSRRMLLQPPRIIGWLLPATAPVVHWQPTHDVVATCTTPRQPGHCSCQRRFDCDRIIFPQSYRDSSSDRFGFELP